MKTFIIELTQLFQDHHISWGLGGSGLLALYGITDQVNDLDLIVDLSDHDRVCQVLASIGQAIPIPYKAEYLTERFSRFLVKGIEIDVMSNFKIAYEKGVYNFVMDTHARPAIPLGPAQVPVTSLEQWLIAYHLMVDRHTKVAMIESYFLDTGDVSPTLLTTYMTSSFPRQVLDQLQQLIHQL